MVLVSAAYAQKHGIRGKKNKNGVTQYHDNKVKKHRRKMKGRGVVDDAKKFYGKHKTKIHRGAAVVGGAALAGLSAYKLAKYRRENSPLTQYMRTMDPMWQPYA